MIRSILFVLLLYSCSVNNGSSSCTIRLGMLLLNEIKIDWGEVQQQKEYIKDIEIFNPTKNTVSLKVHDDILGIRIIGITKDSIDCVNSCLEIDAQTTAIMRIFFKPLVSQEIGDLKKCLHFELNGELYLAPLEMYATVIENIDSLYLHQIKQPEIKLDKDTFDFGVISQKKKIKFFCQVKNTGKGNLIIRKVQTSCNCTKSIIYKQIIFPGESTDLEVEFSAKGRLGLQRRHVILFCNDPLHPLVNIIIKGNVES